MIHLTLTGFQAGRIICGAPRKPENQHVHAQYAVFDKPEILAQYCPDCLALWVADYADEDKLPDWALSIDFRLVHTDPTLLRVRADAQARIQLERNKLDAEARKKEIADALGKEFILTGSDRPADHNPNQQTLF